VEEDDWEQNFPGLGLSNPSFRSLAPNQVFPHQTLRPSVCSTSMGSMQETFFFQGDVP
jgi:hypothetical protein